MANIYAKYQPQLARYLGEYGHLQSSVPIQVTEQDLRDLATTFGGIVMRHCQGNSFSQLFDFFNQHSVIVWDPSGKGGFSVTKTLQVLDGSLHQGECKVIAAALLGLWVFPAPFGLGQGGSSPTATLYTFDNYDSSDGFISHHPKAGIRGLRPNIMEPSGNQFDCATRQPLYQWGDHKCVYYNGRLWDPSYKRVWSREEEMVAFEFTGRKHSRDHQGYQVRVVSGDAGKGWLPGNLMYMKCDFLNGGWRGPYKDL